MYFPEAGAENTDETLRIAIDAAGKRDIGYLVVATTSGNCALKAAGLVEGTEIKMVAVTHNYGFREPGKSDMPDDVREKVRAMGGEVYSGTMLTRGLDRAIKNATGFTPNDVVAQTLRTFGQGTKVCLEIAAMACDAGLIPPEDVIAVAGTGRGADTALLLTAQPSNNFFNIKVREILAKPKDW